MGIRWVIGIDEAGRGPLAGPVAVGVVLIPYDFDWNLLPGVGDSKAISEKKRNAVYGMAMQLAKTEKVWSTVEMASAKTIDTRGIAVVIRECIERGIRTVVGQCGDAVGQTIDWNNVRVLLDGSLTAPTYCIHKETIIKGDAKEPVIGLASIMAKVTRDAYMRRVATRPAFTPYDFARHKGYGTARHRQLIAEHGFSTEHRASYCKNIKIL